MEASEKRRIIRAKVAQARCADLSNQQRLRMEAAGTFPKRIHISDTIVGYFEDEIDAWVAGRIRAGGRTVPRGRRVYRKRGGGRDQAAP